MPLKLKHLPKSEQQRLLKLVELEKRARARGFRHIAGVDEAGRGPLAGPVVAAACLLGEDHFFPGINDSKLLTPPKREALFDEITSTATYGIGIVEHTVIDEINILQASLLAMRRAVAQLVTPPDYLLVDGIQLPTEEIPSEKVVKGDQRSQSIAAASVIAKVTRDRIMRKYHEIYPEYGFDAHKGYGTAKHRKALEKYGPCPIHRRTFAPVNLFRNLDRVEEIGD